MMTWAEEAEQEGITLEQVEKCYRCAVINTELAIEHGDFFGFEVWAEREMTSRLLVLSFMYGWW